MISYPSMSLEQKVARQKNKRIEQVTVADEADEDMQPSSSLKSRPPSYQDDTGMTEDDIGVTLDYQPPPPPSVLAASSDDGSGEAQSVHGGESASNRATVRTRHSSHSRGRRGQRRRRRNRREVGVIQYYSKHWMGQVVSGLFTGLIFFVIGIVFVVYFKHLPNYIGVLFILVSFPPCCMAVNKWRSSRRSRQIRRNTANRRQAIRRWMDEDMENEAYRSGSLPFPDTPPAYDNLGFDARDLEIVINQSRVTRVPAYISEVPPPSYHDAFALKKYNKDVEKSFSEPPEFSDSSKSDQSDSEEDNNFASCSSRV